LALIEFKLGTRCSGFFQTKHRAHQGTRARDFFGKQLRRCGWENGRRIRRFKAWRDALAETGLEIDTGTLSFGERCEFEAKVEKVRAQFNREAIANHAIEHHREAFENGEQEEIEEIDAEWLDRFWDLARSIF
jgi:hypothetical protein